MVKGLTPLYTYESMCVCVFWNKTGVQQVNTKTSYKCKEHFFVCITELQKIQAFEHYTLSEKAMDYRILFMDEDQDRMYVGCKDHVLSMDINNISQTMLKVREQSKPLYCISI